MSTIFNLCGIDWLKLQREVPVFLWSRKNLANIYDHVRQYINNWHCCLHIIKTVSVCRHFKLESLRLRLGLELTFRSQLKSKWVAKGSRLELQKKFKIDSFESWDIVCLSLLETYCKLTWLEIHHWCKVSANWAKGGKAIYHPLINVSCNSPETKFGYALKTLNLVEV